MKTVLKKSLAFIVSLALVLTVMLPCFTFVSLAAGTNLVSYTKIGSLSETDMAKFQSQFDVYTATDATQGLSKVNFDDEFEVIDGVLRHKVDTGFSSHNDYWARYDKAITRLVYNEKKLRNFEMKVQIAGSGATNGTGADFLLSFLTFGVVEPDAWKTANAGYNATTLFQSDGTCDARIFGMNNDTGAYGAIFQDNSTKGFWGWSWPLNLTVRVDGDTVTYTTGIVGYENNGKLWSYTTTLPSTYKGGYVGIAVNDDATRIWDISITDLGGEVEEVIGGIYDFKNDSSAADAVASDFDVYYSDSASAGSLDPVSFEDHFEVTNGVLVHKNTEEMNNDNFWTVRDNNVTNLIYNKGELRNFEIKATMAASGTGDWNNWRRIGFMFGVQDPNVWKKAGYGFEVGINFNLQALTEPYMRSYAASASELTNYTSDPTLMPDFYGWTYDYNFTLRVEGALVTYTWEKVWPNTTVTNSVTYTLGSDYDGGYVGLTFVSDAARVWKLSITDLGEIIEKVEMNGQYDFVNDTNARLMAEYDFDTYYSNNASAGTLSKVAFDTHFEFDDSLRLVHKPTEVMDGDKYFGTIGKNNVTTLLYNKKQMRNFEISMKAKASGTDGYGNWEAIQFMFGVQEPTAWNTAGFGFNATLGFDFTPANKKPSITYFTKYGAEMGTITTTEAIESFYGWGAYAQEYALKVEGNTATYTWTMVWPDITYVDSVTFTLPDDYLGGYVGLKFPSDAANIYYLNVTDLGGEVEEPLPAPDTGDEVILNWDELDIAKLKAGFNVYNGEYPADNGMQALTWDEVVEMGRIDLSSGFHVKKLSDMKYTNTLSNTNKYVTTIINEARTYRDFEMNMKIKSETGVVGIYSGVMFGVQDPTKWGTANAGWCATMQQTGNDVRPIIEGYDSVSDSYKVWAREGFSCEKNGDTGRKFYGALFSYTISLKVVGDTATLTVSQPDYSGTFSCTFAVPESYKGGYVGMMFRGDNVINYQFDITDLGGTVEETGITEVTVESSEKAVASVPVGAYGDDLVLPATVKVKADDGNEYDAKVEWDITSYDRFTLGTYEATGKILGTTVGNVYVYPAGATATMNLTVTGDADLDPITVACVGDSITYGDTVTMDSSYPSRLQSLLGGLYDVKNFGVCGTTASSTVGVSYRTSAEYKASLSCNADIIIIMLGTNDAWSAYWGVGKASGVTAEEHFKAEYTSLVDSYVNANPEARIILATPATYYGTENRNEIFVSIIATINELASERGYEVIDINTATADKKDWFPDGVHPNRTGYCWIANEMAKGILEREQVIGDIDCDGNIDDEDYTAITKILLTDSKYDERLDINHDGVFDVLDAILVRKLAKK